MTVLTDDTNYKAIADAIREKNGTTETYKPSEMAGAIKMLSANSSGGDFEALVNRNMTTLDCDLSNVGEYAFACCNQLTTANFPNLITVAGQGFYKCVALSSVNLPVAQTLGQNAFSGCKGLQRVVFPEVTSIGAYLFSNCDNLEMVDFHKQLSIENNTFSSCFKFKTLVLRSNTVCPLAHTNALSSCFLLTGTTNEIHNPNGARGYIYVPSALVSQYKATANWSTLDLKFRALESYTVDGTITGELDESKI